jgi:hypothetical protein
VSTAPPLGITFLPTDDHHTRGPRRGNRESDLLEAFKILSLRMPRVPGASAIAPSSLLNALGASAVPGGFNPLRGDVSADAPDGGWTARHWAASDQTMTAASGNLAAVYRRSS